MEHTIQRIVFLSQCCLLMYKMYSVHLQGVKSKNLTTITMLSFFKNEKMGIMIRFKWFKIYTYNIYISSWWVIFATLKKSHRSWWELNTHRRMCSAKRKVNILIDNRIHITNPTTTADIKTSILRVVCALYRYENYF